MTEASAVLPDNERKLSCREACEILECSKSYLYLLIQKGILPAYKKKGRSRGMWVYEKDCIPLKESVLICKK